MTPVAIGFCPATPLLSPEVSVSDAGVADIRSAARDAIAAVVAPGPAEVVVVGAAPQAADYRGSYDWRGFGVLRSGDGPGLPRALGVGDWLLDDAGWEGPRRFVGVPQTTPPAACAAIGRDLLRTDTATAVLCIGDGSARRTEKAPGHLDERAIPYDDAVAEALASGDAAALAALDPVLAADLLVEGRSAWQVAAALASGRDWDSRRIAHTAPYGVAWFVATWHRRQTS